MSDYVIGDLVAFENLNVDSIETADMNDVGVVVGIDEAPNAYGVYWFKTKKMTSNLAPHLKLLYTIEEQ